MFRPRPGLIVLLAVVLAPPAIGARQDTPARSPNNASYTLNATLDPVNREIYGRGRLTWRNVSKSPATELRFHTYWNAWRDPYSTWMRERRLAGDSASAARPDEDRGSIDVTTLARVTPAGVEDLHARAHYIAPDDRNAEDRTVLAVPLDQPVPPGGSIEIDLGWNAHVPRVFDRTGALGNYFFIAQWFPKIGVLEDDGWNCHQFHASTEFFADFGVYDVRLTLPAGWTVGATGVADAAVANGQGGMIHHFVERDVHDFAFAASPDFVERRGRFEAPGLPPVDIRLLLQPAHVGQADRHLDAARAALARYGAWFGPYPYGHLTIVDPVTIVDPAAQGESTGGMEYPTLIASDTSWLAPRDGNDPEYTVIHEVGHQFWYGIVATNEVEHAWMDEGLDMYSDARVQADAYPNRFVLVKPYFGGLVPWSYRDVRWSRETEGSGLDAYRLNPARDVPSAPSWRYWPGAAEETTYAKTALWMGTLERLLGWPVMQKVLSTYFAQSAFRHPTPDEFFATASEVSGQDLRWFFDAVYRSSATFDYSVDQVTAEQTPSGAIDTTVTVRRLGDGVFPVDVRVTFDDESSIVERWDGADRWHAFRIRHGTPARTAEVDPDHVLLLDLNRTNNSWTAQPLAAEAARKWSLRWLTWFEHLMLTYAFFS